MEAEFASTKTVKIVLIITPILTVLPEFQSRRVKKAAAVLALVQGHLQVHPVAVVLAAAVDLVEEAHPVAVRAGDGKPDSWI